MKVRYIKVENYKNLADVSIDLTDVASPICVTGGNGAGKTTLLEIISESLAVLGISGGGQQVEVDELDDDARLSEIVLDFSDEAWIEEELINGEFQRQFGMSIDGWNGTLTIKLNRQRATQGWNFSDTITMQGVDHLNVGTRFASWLATKFDARNELKYLMIDSNRAYLKETQHNWDASLLRAIETITGKKAATQLRATDLYHQWLAYMNRVNIKSLTDSRERIRIGRDYGNGQLDNYEDPFESLNLLVKKVLPHLQVVGANPDTKQLHVLSGSKRIAFDDLSGGEREILFLLGQFDRLHLTKGILLIDEPELHLNPELIRKLVAAVGVNSSEGQIWMATHSFEAIETVGVKSTLLLERNEQNGVSISSLDKRPVVSTLAGLMGRAGFSISGRRFVLIEGGGTSLRERPRFEELTADQQDLTYLAVGENKHDVLTLLANFNELSKATSNELTILAIVDADYDSLPQGAISNRDSCHQLGVHEVENLFIQPEAIEYVGKVLRNDIGGLSPAKAIQEAADRYAGKWVWQRAQYFENPGWGKLGLWSELPPIQKKFRRASWNDLQSNRHEFLDCCGDVHANVRDAVEESIKKYQLVRARKDLWMHCCGKEVLDDFSSIFGWSDSVPFERSVISGWESGTVAPPTALAQLNAFLSRVR
jgi:predicted ATPase